MVVKKKGIFLLLLLFTLTACDKKMDFHPERSIHLLSREDGSGTRGAFVELFLLEEKTETTRKDLTSKEAIITNKTDVMITNINEDVHAIGYISLGSLSPMIKPLKIDGIMPSKENVKNGSYSVTRPFIIATRFEQSELEQEFIRFILSSEGQNIVDSMYIAISEEELPFKSQYPEGKIVIAGSSSVAPIMEKLIEAYGEINEKAQIEMQTSDSTAGITGLIDGTCDIGMSSRDLSPNEKKELNYKEIARDAIVVVVNPNNPIEALETKEVSEIYKGNIEKWQELLEKGRK